MERFGRRQLGIVGNSVQLAEELVSDFYKLSASQWLRRRYDVKTLCDLAPGEIVTGPFAQVIRYELKRKDAFLGSSRYDLYRICLQDHAILDALAANPRLSLFPFNLYIMTHELVHVIRFCEFLQYFHAPPEEKITEEQRVHALALDILKDRRIDGLDDVLSFFDSLARPFDVVSC